MLPAPSGEALSPAIILGEVAVAVGSEAVYGVDLATGEPAWQVGRDGGPLSMPAAGSVGSSDAVLYVEGPAEPQPSPSPSAGASTGPTSSPTTPSGSVSPTPGDAVGAGVTAGSTSTLVAVALDDQHELWRLPLEAVSRSGVTVDGPTAYVGDQDGHVVAVDLADGSVTWSAQVPGRVDTPVAVADGKVYAVARDGDAAAVTIVALDAATGDEAWDSAPQASSTASSAAAAGDGAVVVGSADRFVRSLTAEAGTQTWGSLVLSFFFPATAPAIGSGSVYAADVSGGLYRFDAADGSRLWSHQLNEVVLRSAPVISGPTILLGLNDGRLVAVDQDSGHLVWQSDATPGLIGTIALGSDVVVAVKGGRNAGLIAFEPDPQGTLVDVPSPSELDPAPTVSRYVVAAAIVFVGALIPGILLGRRFGRADLGGPTGEDEDGFDDAGEEEGEA